MPIPDPAFDRRAAALLRAAANDLKRDDTAAEADLDLDPGTFAQLTSGERPVSWDLLCRAAEVWPLNERDLLPVHDDTSRRVRILRAKESLASSRVLARGGTDYYEYRDTAMSRVASYRPEWIRMLQVVDDDDADNPAVQWNRGHLLYQFTYFVGPVNYYYRWQHRSICVPMETGDSVWGLPFAPHSFTARATDEPAYILALTYGGDLVGDAQRELAVLGSGAAHRTALRRETSSADLLSSFLRSKAVTQEELVHRSGLSAEHLTALVAGDRQPSGVELAQLAEALGVSPRDLLPPRTRTDGGVVIQRSATAHRWDYPAGTPAYRFTRLAGDPSHPHTTALEAEVRARSDDGTAWLSTYQHSYLYVLGDQPVRLRWEADGQRSSEELRPGDSAYVMPEVPLSFVCAGPQSARLLLLRIAGAVRPAVRHALGAMPDGGIERYLDEDRLWYSKEGN